MKWQDIVGNEEAKHFLQKLLTAKQRPHAFLLTGVEGIGKRCLAQIFAQTLFCDNDIEPCGSCSSCIRLRSNNHPDYFFIEPELKKDEQTRKNTIGIEQIRFLSKEAAYAPKLAKHRIVIIDSAHLLTVEAANSLLKLLEEPPNDWVFVLLAASIENMLATILSRVVVIRMKPLTAAEIMSLLEQKGFTNIEENKLAASLSEGSLGKAMEYTTGKAIAAKNKALDFLQFCFANDFLAISSLLEGLEREEAVLLCEIATTFVRDAWQIKFEQAESVWYKDVSGQIEKILANFTMKELKLILQSVEQTLFALKNSANVRLAMEGLFVALSDIQQGRILGGYSYRHKV